MNATILLTGATGFLGTQLARHAWRSTDHRLLALVRGSDEQEAVHRLRRAWWDWPELSSEIGKRIQVVCGDIASDRLGLAEGTYHRLARQVSHIIHAAADLRMNGPIDELRKANRQGVANILAFAGAARQEGRLFRLAHVSTAYICGGRTGAIPEEALTPVYGFSCAYELSKFEGEQLVQAARAELPISVFRPGLIVGDSQTGYIKTFNTVYFPARLYLAGKLMLIPGDPRTRVNLIPVDYVAQAILQLTFDPRAEGLNFHLTAPREALPSAGELVDFGRRWAREHLEVDLPAPIFVPLPILRGRYHPGRPGSSERSPRITHDLLALLPYFNEHLQFRRENTDRLLGPYHLEWRAFLPHLLEFAVSKGFLHRSGRTVHEQVIFRLASKRRPVRYHDVSEGKIVSRSAAQLRRDMVCAAGSLAALGVRPGDRVALSGARSSRKHTIETAIGLAGAVTVPLEAGRPPADLDAILRATGAKLLFSSEAELFARLGEIETDIPVISFCREPLPRGIERTVLDWADFLARGPARTQPVEALVGPGDPAILRLAPGKTGPPVALALRHDALQRMAEAAAAQVPWKIRFKLATSLSFDAANGKEESAVQEYAPFYYPAPLDIYFLEDPQSAAAILSQNRPSNFSDRLRPWLRHFARLFGARQTGLNLPAQRNTVPAGAEDLEEPFRPFYRSD